MKIFVLRTQTGEYLDRNFEIGPLFDAGALFESENAEKTSISTEELETVLAEIKESRKITT